MSSELLFQQALNGLSFGALLFILAAGLSLVFGMMDVVNLAHGAFYMLGAYVALSVTRVTGSFWVALVVAPLALAIFGLVVEPLARPDALPRDALEDFGEPHAIKATNARRRAERLRKLAPPRRRGHRARCSFIEEH